MQDANQLAFTVTWEVSDGNAEKSADIIARFAPEARKEPSLGLLMVNRCTENPSQFLFYEIFGDAAALAGITADRLVRHLEQSGFVLMKRPPAAVPSV
jgi:hypothetical protein